MHHDPFTLRVALDRSENASGELYLDDGETYANQRGEVVWRKFSLSKRDKNEYWITSADAVAAGKLVVDGFDMSRYSPDNAFAKSVRDIEVERIIVLGLPQKPIRVEASGGSSLQFTWEQGSPSTDEGVASRLTLKDPGMRITENWEVSITT